MIQELQLTAAHLMQQVQLMIQQVQLDWKGDHAIDLGWARPARGLYRGGSGWVVALEWGG
jgi:hypothetical protein